MRMRRLITRAPVSRRSAGVALGEGRVELQLSVPVLGHPPAAFLNIGATLVQTLGLPRLDSLRVGRLPVPTALVDLFAPTLLRWLGRDAEVRMALDALQQVRMSASRLTIVYRWQGGGPFRAGSSVFAAADRERLLRQQTLLATNSRRDGSAPARSPGCCSRSCNSPPSVRPGRCDRREPGGDPGDDPARARRAAAQVLRGRGLAAARRPQRHARWPRRPGRALHAVAAIAAYADTALADAIGLYKEIEDCAQRQRVRSTTFAADRAGTDFREEGRGRRRRPGSCSCRSRRSAGHRP
ncbi:MAG: hypothetical protein IPI40_13630 [Betaproteobacteria bacterium]|nr:hypothetical protein [Betaproteobacteria bacterium]